MPTKPRAEWLVNTDTQQAIEAILPAELVEDIHVVFDELQTCLRVGNYCGAESAADRLGILLDAVGEPETRKGAA